MSKLRRSVVISSALAALVVPAAAQAAGPSWHTLDNVNGAKVQACRVKVSNGWKIKGRVNARKSSERATGSLIVTHNNQETKKKWTSTVSAHHLGRAGSIVVPAKPGYSVTYTLGLSQMGDGGTIATTKIGRC
jgi:hypothetical protein